MPKVEISTNAEKEVGKACINVFYLIVIAIFVTNPLKENFKIYGVPLAVYSAVALLSLIMGIWLISHADKREERKAKNAMLTEIKKGVFHIQNAELTTEKK